MIATILFFCFLALVLWASVMDSIGIARQQRQRRDERKTR